MNRIYLSPPDVGPEERRMLLDAFDSGWISPVGPHIAAFERECAAAAGVSHAAALSSGTAGLHLALHALGIEPDADVITATMTFAATANAIRYVGARPVFLDVSRDTWTMDPDLLDEELDARRRLGKPAAAVLTVDLYGQCADYARIVDSCRRHQVPLVEDAAEALGATCGDAKAGSFGECAVFSFNGNKIITTGGGGMLVSDRKDLVDRARFLGTQARDPAPHYQHSVIGYNYRLSNLLAALGRAQLDSLPRKIQRRREVRARYESMLKDAAGIEFMPEAAYGKSNGWLTCILVTPSAFGATREDIRLALEAENIEARPLWKPMHLQPVFRECDVRSRGVSDDLFERGLCLPSGSNLTPDEQTRIVELIARVARRGISAAGVTHA